MIADISAHTLIKGVDFTGREISISGVSDSNSNLIAVIKGPDQDYNVWRKKKIGGIWSKHNPHLFKNIPSYFFVTSSYDVKKSIPDMLAYSLGVESHKPFLPSIKKDNKSFYLELIKIKQKANLYPASISTIEKVGKQIFRFKAYIPCSASIGKYTVDIYKVNGNVIKDTIQLQFNIDNIGFDRAITVFSNRHPLEYGVLAVIIALITGSLVGFLFRKDR